MFMACFCSLARAVTQNLRALKDLPSLKRPLQLQPIQMLKQLSTLMPVL